MQTLFKVDGMCAVDNANSVHAAGWCWCCCCWPFALNVRRNEFQQHHCVCVCVLVQWQLRMATRAQKDNTSVIWILTCYLRHTHTQTHTQTARPAVAQLRVVCFWLCRRRYCLPETMVMRSRRLQSHPPPPWHSPAVQTELSQSQHTWNEVSISIRSC